MAFQIVINVIIAFMWMFLSETYTFASFLSGTIIGVLLLLLLNCFVPGKFYLHRVVKIIQLSFLFVKELFASYIYIVKLVYKPKFDAKTGIFALPVVLETDWQITMLANLITLTPGTLSVVIAPDNSEIYIHAMDIDDIDESVEAIKNPFERAIMEVS